MVVTVADEKGSQCSFSCCLANFLLISFRCWVEEEGGRRRRVVDSRQGDSEVREQESVRY